MIDDVEFALHRIDDDLVERLVEVERIAVQPVVLERMARQVDVQLARVVGRGLARADVVRLAGVVVLDEVVEEVPFPDDGAALVDFGDRIQLAAGGGRRGGIGSGGDQLGVGIVLVGDVDRGVLLRSGS